MQKIPFSVVQKLLPCMSCIKAATFFRPTPWETPLRHSADGIGKADTDMTVFGGDLKPDGLPCSSEEQTIRSCFVAERMMSKIFKCDTLEELAKAMGVPDDKMDTFMASIDEYNAMCDAGRDDKFGKDASALIPIREAPFYGCAQTLGNRSASPSMVTMNGMMADLNLNVLDVDYAPIKGLYAAGNSLGGRYGTGYSTPCAGNSIGMAVTHGRLAGQFCVDNA